MESPILITWLNDFVFCPASIYFHNLYGDTNRLSFQEESQINGTHAHEAIDNGEYSTRANILCGIDVFCERYGLVGKIDIFETKTGVLSERKKKIKTIYDGYIFQIYGQCFALREMGYSVKKLILRSLDDNKTYPIPLPEEDPAMLDRFNQTIKAIYNIDLSVFKQENAEKCAHCIYEPLCDSSLLQKGGVLA